MTYPNVLVMGYLKATGQLTPETAMKLKHAIHLGYQRLLTFETPDGGFDWYGRSPGKTILTAYGLLEITAMSKVHDVDPAWIARIAKWLLAQQMPDGRFPAEGCPHSWRGTEGSSLAATAYVTWALLEAGHRDPASASISWLRRHAEEAQDPRDLALLANALVAWNADHEFTRGVLRRLEAAAIRDGRQSHWESALEGFVYSSGASAHAETTALATYALLRGRGSPERANGALEWLSRAKSANGTWGSTQATILAIQALLAAAQSGGSALKGTVEVRASLNGGPTATLTFAEGKTDYLQQLSFRGQARAGGNRLRLEATAESGLVWQTVGRAWIPGRAAPAPDAGPLELSVTYDRTTLSADETLRAQVRVATRAENPTFMVIADLGVPPGFEPLTEDLEQLVARRVIDKFALPGRQVTVYLGDLARGKPIEFSFRMRARFPVRAAVPPSTVYEYYTPSRRAEASGLPEEVDVR